MQRGVLVRDTGLEPVTLRLKGECSAAELITPIRDTDHPVLQTSLTSIVGIYVLPNMFLQIISKETEVSDSVCMSNKLDLYVLSIRADYMSDYNTPAGGYLLVFFGKQNCCNISVPFGYYPDLTLCGSIR